MKLNWLIESIAQKQAITDCDRFLFRFSSSGKQNDLGEDGADAPSPASKRSIMSMNGSISRPENRRRLEFANDKSNADKTVTSPDAPPEENVMIDQYLNASVNPSKEFKVPQALANVPQQKEDAQQQANHTVDSECNSDFSLTFSERTFLTGLVVSVIGFDENSKEMLEDECKSAGAVVISDENFSGSVDYLILPLDVLSMHDIQVKAKYVVNNNWLVS